MIYLTEQQAYDRNLIHYLAKQAIDEPILSLKKLGGAMSWNYDVNDHLIFKLPRKNSLVQAWENQEKIAPLLKTKLDTNIPLPFTKKIFMTSTAKEALTSVQYEKILGICINPRDFQKMPLVFKEKFFEQLTQMIIQLHSVPLELFPFEFKTKLEYVKKYLSRRWGAEEIIDSELFDRLIFNSCFGLKKDSIKNDNLCHSDLHSGNVCLDSKGNIIGLLDFDTLSRGDTFMEFRPNLYQKDDMNLLLNKYLKTAPYPLDLEQINRLKKISHAFQFFAIFYKLFQLGIQPGQKLKQIIQHKKETSK